MILFFYPFVDFLIIYASHFIEEKQRTKYIRHLNRFPKHKEIYSPTEVTRICKFYYLHVATILSGAHHLQQSTFTCPNQRSISSARLLFVKCLVLRISTVFRCTNLLLYNTDALDRSTSLSNPSATFVCTVFVYYNSHICRVL